MTNEEAIDLLDNLIGMVEDNHNSDYDKALQMAIKALEELPKRRKEAKRWKRRAAQNNRATFECGYDIGYRDGKYGEYQPDAYRDIERLTREEQA